MERKCILGVFEYYKLHGQDFGRKFIESGVHFTINVKINYK